MTSCDDEFAPLLGGGGGGDEEVAVSFSAAGHRFVPPGVVHSRRPLSHLDAIGSNPSPNNKGGGGEHVEGFGEAFAQADDCFADGDPGSDNLFASPHPRRIRVPQQEEDDDDDKSRHPKSRPSDPKRKERGDDLSDDGESPSPYAVKKSRPSAAAAPSSSGDYRKDREEWSDSAIGCLLDAYRDKNVQLNRGNLRGRDWEEVAAIVSERSDKPKSGKTVEQCKNKVDNLKKRYKVECQRIGSGSLPVSHWPWFKKMEQIVGSSSSSSTSKLAVAAVGTTAADDVKCPSAIRQIKRYPMAGGGSIANNFNKVSNPRWKRVLLKISGAALAGSGPQNVDPEVINMIAKEVAKASRVGVQVAIAVGGRNFFCGETCISMTATGTDRATTYQIGMMASAMNSLLLQASFEKIGVETRVQTAFTMQEIAEPYIRRRAIRHLEKGRVVIFGGIGSVAGNPLFTTDTAAALRASEINAGAVLKGINTESVYECHSRNSSNAFEHFSFRECISRGFTAMDMTTLTCCEENNIPVVLFDFLEPGNISRALCGDQVGTLIDQSGRIG